MTGTECWRAAIVGVTAIVSWTTSSVLAQETAWKTLYASPNGIGDECVLAKPGSLASAQARVRSLNRQMTGDIVVILKDGTYDLSGGGLVFTEADSGRGDHRVIWRAENRGKAILSGGRRITGWKTEAGVWKTSIPEVRDGKLKVRELFVNGQRAQRARHPNTGFLRVAKVGADRRTTFQFKEGDVPAVEQVGHVELVFFHDWSVTRTPLKAIDQTTRTVTMAHRVGSEGADFWLMDGFEANPRYYLENSVEFLDAPGEWFMDAGGVVQYRPRPGEEIDNVEAWIPVATNLLRIAGDETEGKARPVRNLVFQDMSFVYCAWNPEYYIDIQAGHQDYGVAIPSAVSLFMAEGCRFEHMRFEHLGGSAIDLGIRGTNCALVGSVIRDVSGNGVSLGDAWSRKVPEPPGFTWSPNKNQLYLDHPYLWFNKAPEQIGRNNVIENNLIEYIGAQYHGCVGIWAGLTASSRIARNEIRYMHYSGISIGWVWAEFPTPAGRNVVENNHIHHVMQWLSDGAGIYTLGRQPESVLRGNLIHDVPVNAGRAESNGIFMDEGSSGFVVESNAIYNIAGSPVRFNSAGANRVRGNLLITRSGRPINFGNTQAAKIEQTDNVILPNPPKEGKEINTVFERIQQAAGPEDRYRTDWGL